MIDESDLPDELQSRGGDTTQNQDAAEKLSALGKVIAAKRDEAVRARKASGIEDVWMAAEQAYISMDAANAHEFAQAKWAKPTSVDGPVTRQAMPDETKSTAFIPLTQRYVDAATAMVSEIILPVDGKAFALGPTPVPTLVDHAEDDRQIVDDAPGGTGQPLTRPATPEDAAQPGIQPAQPAQPGQPPAGQPTQPAAQVPLTVADLAKEKQEQANAQAEKAEKRIYDWMVQAKYPMQMRKVVFDAARIGVGVLKGPFPNQRRRRALETVDGGVKLTFMYETTPDMRGVNPWNCYPDGSCGENPHDGDHFLECDFINPGKLKDLKRQKTSDGKAIYLSGAIDRVIEEGPEKINADTPRMGDRKGKDKRFTIWYFYGRLDKEDLAAAGAVGLEELPEDITQADAIITLVNDTVIRVALNPLDSGAFPYRVLGWSRRDGHWAGRGVGEQVSIAQRIVNSGTRRMLENAGKSAGCQFVIDQQSITPSDGTWSITPDKVWLKNPDASMDDVRKAFLSVQIQNVTDQLMKIIEYGFKIAEEASSIPLVTQGQDGDTTPQTFGQAELQNTNAHTILRAKAYAVDDCITEPLVNDLYDWLLMDPNVPNDEKGDFDIDAHGSIVMVERAIQEVFYMALLQFAANPAYGLNAKRTMAEGLKSKRINVEKVSNTKDEQAKIDAAPPPSDPRIEAAKIMAGSRSEDIKARTDRDTEFVRAEQEKNTNDHNLRMEELATKRELAMLDYANKRAISLDAVKAELAGLTMKLNTQKDLSLADHVSDIHKHHNPVITPPTEPVGRAAPGRAFEA